MSKPTTAIPGLGAMGLPMATRRVPRPQFRDRPRTRAAGRRGGRDHLRIGSSGGRIGLDKKQVLETLMACAAASFMLGDRGQRRPLAYEPEGAEVKSRLDIFVEGMGIVNAACRSVQLAAPVAAAAGQLHLLGQAQQKQGLDDSAIITVLAPEE